MVTGVPTITELKESINMKITKAMIEEGYSVAKKIYEEQLNRKEGLNDLVQNYGMNPNSAADFLQNFNCMINGRKYSRTNSAKAVDYFLDRINLDYGNEKLQKALSAVKAHIEYYEDLKKYNLYKMRNVYDKYFSIIQNVIYPEEVTNTATLYEGVKKQITVNAYERSLEAREECINYYGAKCSVCEFDFHERYGEIGLNFIHVHHLIQLSSIGENYNINPITDLRPVCPNCHAMLHKRNPPYKIEELKNIIHNV